MSFHVGLNTFFEHINALYGEDVPVHRDTLFPQFLRDDCNDVVPSWGTVYPEGPGLVCVLYRDGVVGVSISSLLRLKSLPIIVERTLGLICVIGHG